MNRAARIALIACAALASVGFLLLALWQVQRLDWKQDLIARIDRQLQAAPVAPPAAHEVSADDAYRRVRLLGHFEPGEVLAQATTELGGGHWVLTPLRLDDGRVVLVNRGFVPPEQRDPERRPAPAGRVELVGLLRWTEPNGGPLRRNDPAQGRWYSRDVSGMAAQLKLAPPVMPYFVDEERDASQPQRWPRPGLTVLRFTNNHAVYAITWLALSVMSAAAAVYLVREERRRATS